MSHPLQFIISSKDLANLKKSLCTRDKARKSEHACFWIPAWFCHGTCCVGSGTKQQRRWYSYGQSSIKVYGGKVENCLHVLWFKSGFEKIFADVNSTSSRLKRRWTICFCFFSAQFKSMDLPLVPVSLPAWTSGKVRSILNGVYKFKSNKCSHPDQSF